MRRLYLGLLILACIGINSQPAAAQGTVRIDVINNAFVMPGTSTPFNPTVTAGTTIEWVFVAGAHSSTSDTGLWDSGIIDPLFTPDPRFTRVFNTPGDFAYYCSLHSGPGQTFMNG